MGGGEITLKKTSSTGGVYIEDSELPKIQRTNDFQISTLFSRMSTFCLVIAQKHPILEVTLWGYFTVQAAKLRTTLNDFNKSYLSDSSSGGILLKGAGWRAVEISD